LDSLGVVPPGGDDELERVTFSWPERERAAPWQVTVTWRFTDEAAVPVAVEVRSNTGPITARAWRTVRVQEVIDASRERLSDKLLIEAMRRDYGRDLPPEVTESESGPKRPGRPRHLSDEFLADVARVYADAVAHHSRRPVREVAERLGSDVDAPAVAKGWVSEARRRGFIT
jgi:hypothetical protein